LPSLPNFPTARNYIGGQKAVNIELIDVTPIQQLTYCQWTAGMKNFVQSANSCPLAHSPHFPQLIFSEQTSRSAASTVDD
jgi:hypothetical protein